MTKAEIAAGKELRWKVRPEASTDWEDLKPAIKDEWAADAMVIVNAYLEAVRCQWRVDREGIWETGCGTLWECTADGPAENGQIFCHGCGRKIEVVP